MQRYSISNNNLTNNCTHLEKYRMVDGSKTTISVERLANELLNLTIQRNCSKEIFDNEARTNISFHHLDATNKIAVILLYSLFVFGILGNSIVIFTFVRCKNRTLFEKRLVLLAMIDLMSSICVPPLFIYGTLTSFQGSILTEPVCIVWISSFPFSISVSQGVLLFISFERYYRIQNPFKKPLKIRLYFIAVLVLAAIIVSPYASTLTDKCYVKDPRLRKATNLMNALRDFIAILAMCYFNYKIGQSYRCKNNNLIIKTSSNKDLSQEHRNNMRVYRTLIKMVVVFSMLVLPYDLLHLALSYFLSSFPAYLNPINTMLVVLQVSNSVGNVLIYSISDENFRRRLVESVKSAIQGETRRDATRRWTISNIRNASFSTSHV
ncbi:succinate receptor 1-like [Clytia hemisphaerica]|uniref:G-protein coupled receptors family 1 profile domain-containing protein n=1 Tax=Clytia hemisphaerica TaxID=252671 RepID=A0A7M5U548_9CNID